MTISVVKQSAVWENLAMPPYFSAMVAMEVRPMPEPPLWVER